MIKQYPVIESWLKGLVFFSTTETHQTASTAPFFCFPSKASEEAGSLVAHMQIRKTKKTPYEC